MNQRVVIVYDPTQIHFGSDILEIVAVSVFLDTANTLSSLEIRENLNPPRISLGVSLNRSKRIFDLDQV